MRDLPLQIGPIIQAHEMADQATDNAGVYDDQHRFVAVDFSDGFDEAHAAFLHLAKAFAFRIDEIRVFFVAGYVLLHPFFTFCVQHAVVHFIERLAAANFTDTTALRIKKPGATRAMQLTGVHGFEMDTGGVQHFINMFHVSLPACHRR